MTSAIALAVCYTVGPWIARRMEGLAPWRFIVTLLALGVAAAVGGRAHFVLANSAIFSGRWTAALAPAGGSFHAGGAILFMVLAVFPIARLLRVSTPKLADALAPTIALGVAISRVNCWIRGCCFGDVCHVGWCITLPKGSFAHRWQVAHRLIAPDAAHTLPLHPLQLYFVAAGVLVLAAALWTYRRKRFDGEVALVALLVFGVTSFALEFLRAPFTDRLYWGPLPQLAWTALGLGVVAAVWLAVGRRRARRDPSTPAVATAVG
jgi:phosphatidylglycerol:prolipoprotein diacylglycerol transferase